MNLWPPQSFAEGFTPTSEPMIERSLPGDESDPEGGGSDEDRNVASSSTSGISSAVFMGNFTLFVSLLLAILLVHVTVASAVEAYWLAKVRTSELLSFL